jgi:hypothetical protein
VGARTAQEVEVAHGLAVGDVVILTPNVNPGARVSVR